MTFHTARLNPDALRESGDKDKEIKRLNSVVIGMEKTIDDGVKIIEYQKKRIKELESDVKERDSEVVEYMQKNGRINVELRKCEERRDYLDAKVAVVKEERNSVYLLNNRFEPAREIDRRQFVSGVDAILEYFENQPGNELLVLSRRDLIGNFRNFFRFTDPRIKQMLEDLEKQGKVTFHADIDGPETEGEKRQTYTLCNRNYLEDMHYQAYEIDHYIENWIKGD